MEKKKILVMTVGGSIEPCKQIKGQYGPDKVIFIVSRGSLGQVGDIGYNPEMDDTRKLEDHTNTVNCADECYRWLKELMAADVEILADITGGTKTMSAGLAYAALQLGIPTSYVDGEKRDKQGLGVVISDSFIRTFPNFLYSRDVASIWEHMRTYDWRSAQNTISHVLTVIDDVRIEKNNVIKQEFTALQKLTEALQAWDLFDHKNAKIGITETIRLWESLRLRSENDAKLRQLLVEAQNKLQQLHDSPTANLCVDLFFNAKRKFEIGLFDDAMARLYRFVEMTVQWLLLERYNIKTADLMIGLEKSWDKYCELAPSDEMATCYKTIEKKLKDVLSFRNMSILAHGFHPLTKEKAQIAFATIALLFDRLQVDKRDLFQELSHQVCHV